MMSYTLVVGARDGIVVGFAVYAGSCVGASEGVVLGLEVAGETEGREVVGVTDGSGVVGLFEGTVVGGIVGDPEALVPSHTQRNSSC